MRLFILVSLLSLAFAQNPIDTVITTTNDLGLTVTLTQQTIIQPTPGITPATTTTPGVIPPPAGAITTTSPTTNTATRPTTGTATTTTPVNPTAVTTPTTTPGVINTATTGTPLTPGTATTGTATGTGTRTTGTGTNTALTTARTNTNTRATTGTTTALTVNAVTTGTAPNPIYTYSDRTTTYVTSSAWTSIWITVTYPNGGVATVQTTYSQRFTSMFESVETPPQGTIGLGSVSGTVGIVKTNNFITLSSTNFAKQNGISAFLVFIVSVFLL